MKKIVLIIALAVITSQAAIATVQTRTWTYDSFDDSLIDPNLWWVLGSVSEENGKLILDAPTGANAGVDALSQPLIGMWCSVQGYQSGLKIGDHVNIHLATITPDGQTIVVGLYRDFYNQYGENNYVFCQWFRPNTPMVMVNLSEANWGATYVLGLEYTIEGSVLVWVNGQVVYSFAVSGSDSVYLKGGSRFWFRSFSVAGTGSVTAEINWAEAKEIIRPVASFTYPVNLLVGRNIIFDASGSYDPDGTIVNYEWDFGDGSSSSDKIPTHSYLQSGLYTVSLTVTDDDGLTDTKTAILDIKNMAPDIDKDNDIDLDDIGIIVGHWLDEDCICPDWCAETDLNHDGVVNFEDFVILAHNWLKESGAVGVSEHTYHIEVWYDAAHDNPLDLNQVEYGFDIEVATDGSVARMELITPEGKTFSISSDPETWDDANQIWTSRYFNEDSGVWEWEFEKSGSNINLFDDFGDGTYTLNVFYANGSYEQTQVVFADICTGEPFPMPTQIPRIIFPAYQATVESPIMVNWQQCVDPTVNSIWVDLWNDASGADFGSPFDKEQTSWESVDLNDGYWYASIDFDNYHTAVNADGIEVGTGKSRNSEQSFTVETILP